MQSQNALNALASGSDIQVLSGGGNGGNLPVAITQSAPASAPTQTFDISVLSGLKPTDKYLGKNRVSDITEAYQTYLTGNPVGKGGQYAVDAAKKYGVSIIEAARGYLQGVGLPIVSSVTTQNTTQNTTNGNNTVGNNTVGNNPFQILADILPQLFGNAVYNPPLQQQAYGYTPSTTSTPLTSGGGSSIGLIVIVGIIGVIGYFLYKRFAH